MSDFSLAVYFMSSFEVVFTVLMPFFSDTYDSYGCDGGLTIYAYYYVYKTGGLQTNASYPYTSYYDVDGTCVSDSDDYEVTVDDYYYLSSEDSMESHVLTYGPLSVCLDASTWASYTNGTMTTCGTDVDHCVQAVGINSDDDYWVVRNSWGTDWGQEGYIYLKSVSLIYVSVGLTLIVLQVHSLFFSILFFRVRIYVISHTSQLSRQ